MPEITLFIDSTLGNNLSSGGDTFDYVLQPALSLPFDVSPELRVLEANVFYTSPNVSAVKNNNTLRFAQITSGTIEGNTASLDEHTIVFEDGLYSLQDLRDEISAFCLESNIHDSALDVIGHGPTQKTEFRWDVQGTAYGIILYLSDANSIGSLLGFNSVDIYYDYWSHVTPLEQAHFRSNNSANFDAVSLFLLTASCLSGVNYDATGSGGGQVAAAITPDVSPGSLIRYRPLHPLPCQAESLRGNRASSITFSITDNNGDPVYLKEGWNARILLSW